MPLEVIYSVAPQPLLDLKTNESPLPCGHPLVKKVQIDRINEPTCWFLDPLLGNGLPKQLEAGWCPISESGVDSHGLRLALRANAGDRAEESLIIRVWAPALRLNHESTSR